MRRSEADEQKVVASWLNGAGVLWCHVPNGELRNPRVGAKLKAMGVRRGVPDILIFNTPPNELYSSEGYTGVAIELKSVHDKRGPSKAQREWISELVINGWAARVCKGADEAIRFLRSLGFRSTVDVE